eukprot:TRINITY_DN652_c0_g1_i1.p1 TRINITY_DN652_c0_g1~~TRINITY_DN652_c0_g1_i1.p1  ORF type:complete len:431 (-),score=123.06 TRINITY_DN652_c0_g1_i1:126-1379(-)
MADQKNLEDDIDEVKELEDADQDANEVLFTKGGKKIIAGEKETPEDRAARFAQSLTFGPKAKKAVAKKYPMWPLDRGIELKKGNFLGGLKEVVLAQLERDSKYKKLAMKSGWIRPFLYLVAMHPMMRAGVGRAQKLKVIYTTAFGDPHAEAWYIISKGRRGLKARSEHFFREKICGRNTTWYQCLTRCAISCTHESDGNKELKKTYQKAEKSEKSKKIDALEMNRKVRLMEDDFFFSTYERLDGILQALSEEGGLNRNSYASIEEFHAKASAQTKQAVADFDLLGPEKEKRDLFLANWMDRSIDVQTKERESATRYAAQMFHDEKDPAVIKPGQAATFALPLAGFILMGPFAIIPATVKGVAVAYDRTPGRQYPPLFFMLIAKMRLARMGIHVDKYYSLEGDAAAHTAALDAEDEEA